MYRITLDVETVTPLFIAGANQHNVENEGLRPPSLKGLLRWWFRAIMGGMVSSIDHLRELENEIFGSTDHKSRIRIVSTIMGNPSPIRIPRGLKYLWFSIEFQERQQCYPPNTKFRIDVISLDEMYLKVALGCLWAVIYLGGIGARMRRGAGSLRVTSVEGEPPYEFIFNGKSIYDAKYFIENNLAKIFKVFKEFASKYHNISPEHNLGHNFAILAKRYTKISLINKIFDRWEEALSEVSKIYKQFRQEKKLKHRYTFGLPIVAYNLFKKKRQASPLFIGVMDLNGKYVTRLVKFYTSIHEDFSSKLEFLRRDLDGLDKKISEELGEIAIDIPEV